MDDPVNIESDTLAHETTPDYFPQQVEALTHTPTEAEKLDFLYQTAVKVQNLIDQVTPDDIAKIQKTVGNPLVRKMLGL